MTALVDILRQAGFTGRGLQIAIAVAMAESGGSATAHNPDASTGDNSYGIFQINMLGAMGPERRRQYGLASNDQLYDPLTNAKIAFAMSNGGTNWQPWSTTHVGRHGEAPAYLKYMGTSGAADTGGTPGGVAGKYAGTAGGGAVTTPVQPKIDAATLAAEYGLSTDLINSSKELKSIFGQAVSQQWSPDVFTAHLKNTKWWATQSNSMRQFITLKYTDPATFKAKWDETAAHINSLAVQVGLGNRLGKGTDMNTMDGFLKAAVYRSMQLGWSDERIKSWFGGNVSMSNGAFSGQAAVDYDKLHAYAYTNGLNQSAGWYKSTLQAIEGGRSTTDGVLATLRTQAASKYSAYSTQILAGQNAIDIAAPFAKTVSDLLEINPASVDLNNKYVAKAMTAPLKPGAMPGSQYTVWQVQNDVRADPMWVKTNNARESIEQVARSVGQDFGFSY